jgi:hypothetical protein
MSVREKLDVNILDLMKAFREKNSRLQVTGLLVYQKGTREFMQILEVERQVIFDLLDIIKADKRHRFLKRDAIMNSSEMILPNATHLMKTF